MHTWFLITGTFNTDFYQRSVLLLLGQVKLPTEEAPPPLLPALCKQRVGSGLLLPQQEKWPAKEAPPPLS